MGFSTIASSAVGLRSGETTSLALVEASLRAIDRYNPWTNAFIRIDAEQARASARRMDDERTGGHDRGPLHGIPLSLKDLIDVAGEPTTAASWVLKDRVASRDATIVHRLREAGVVFIGKTNLHEFALGTTSEDSAFGPVKHPRDAARSPGGSSGGSAAAVATGMGLASIGTDTGGSVRIPAAACGVVGLKPTVGEIPTDGVIPLSFSLDHVGPLGRTVQDVAWLWAAMAAQPLDRVVPPEIATLRLGRLTGYFSLLAGEVRVAFEGAVNDLRLRGASIADQTLPGTASIAQTYVNVVLPEGAAWHARYLETRSADYSAAVRARLESGRTIAAVDYLKARAARAALRAAVDAALADCDALVLPTLPIVAPLIGASDVIVDPDSGERLPVRTAMLRHTQLFNLTGHPAVSLPLRTPGLPVGLQLVGHRDRTPRLLAVAATVEKIVCPAV
jgi:aspartyl-tRNA(Asn)/glutamyl-tRNA(Gln) amidotransferase subunit A